jgi:hypothetical protein
MIHLEFRITPLCHILHVPRCARGHLVLAEDDLCGAATEATDDPCKDLCLDTYVGSSSGRNHVRPHAYPVSCLVSSFCKN